MVLLFLLSPSEARDAAADPVRRDVLHQPWRCLRGFFSPDSLGRELSGPAHCIPPPVISMVQVFGPSLIQMDVTVPTSLFLYFFGQAGSEQRHADGKCPENDGSEPQAEAAAESSGHGAVWTPSPWVPTLTVRPSRGPVPARCWAAWARVCRGDVSLEQARAALGGSSPGALPEPGCGISRLRASGMAGWEGRRDGGDRGTPWVLIGGVCGRDLDADLQAAPSAFVPSGSRLLSRC